jgi:hypothetical protein
LYFRGEADINTEFPAERMLWRSTPAPDIRN